MDEKMYNKIKARLAFHWSLGMVFEEVLETVCKEFPEVYRGFIWCMLQVLRSHSIGFKY